MRGVSLRRRRLPANRPAGPARPPVVSGSRTSALAARPCGQRLCRRPRDRARRAVPAGPLPAGVLLPAIAPLMRAPPAGPGLPKDPQPGGTRYKTGTTTLPTNRPAAGDLHRQPMPPPTSRRERRPPRPLAGQPALLLPAPACRRRRPGRGQSLSRHTICPSGSWTGRPAQARSAGPRGSVPKRRVKPCPPPYQPPLPRGCGHCLTGPDRGLTWLASTSPEPATGRICVLTGNRAQPVAGRVVCSQSPVTV